MAKEIFVNLPTKDLENAKKFYQEIGFSINPQFTNDKAACIVISETIYVMILSEPFFKTFLRNKEIADAGKVTESLVALSADSREEVNNMADKAVAAGGTPLRDPEDHGFMYTRSFQDPDGHIWEIFWMDQSKMPQS